MMKVKPSKITIWGRFWDTYLYKNKLFLFNMDNKIINVLEWNRLIRQFCTNPKLLSAYQFAFWNSDYLYKAAANEIFNDPDIKKVLVSKFNKIEDIETSLDNNLEGLNLYKINSSYPSYFTDVEVYNNKVYIGTERGIYFSDINEKRKKTQPALRFKNIKETSFINISRMKLLKGDLLLSAQSEGLYEYSTYIQKLIDEDNNYMKRTALRKVGDFHSSYVGVNFSSILSASYIEEPLLIQRGYDKDEISGKLSRMERNRFKLAEIFNDVETKGFYFSHNEKIYQIKNNVISVALFYQFKKEKKDIFNIKIIGKVNNLNKDSIVSASVETFGLVIECKEKLIVILSDDSICVFEDNLTSKIVTYKTFPRSNCYVNQLHIIYTNKLEIISFNQDYFENQKQKKYGIKFKIEKE